jgi:hypothetical protein
VSLFSEICYFLCLSPEVKFIAGAILPYDSFLGILMMLVTLDAEQEVRKKYAKIRKKDRQILRRLLKKPQDVEINLGNWRLA